MRVQVPLPASVFRRRLLARLPVARYYPTRMDDIACRPGCAACCIAPSISSPIPGMPRGKPAGTRCAQLAPDGRCLLFGKADRPAVCASLRPSAEMCGSTGDEALAYLEALERATAP